MDKNNKPKYGMLVDAIKNDINEGRIKNGDKLPSENTLSAMYGISRHTVRKALSILEIEGLVTAEHGRGTFCTIKEKAKVKTNTVAVVTTYISDYIFPSVINGIYDVMTKNGYNIILKNTKNSICVERTCLEDIINIGVDGLIIEPSKSQIFCRNLELYEKLDNAGIPYVFIHGRYSQMEDKAHVLMNDEAGAYNVTKYLAELGHRKIAGIFKADDSQGGERHKGFARGLRENGIEYDPELVIWYHTEDKKVKPRTEIRKLLETGKITAVMCYNDQIATTVIKEINSMGLSVPEAVSVTGFDDSSIAEEIGITTVTHPKEEVGRHAAELLLKLMNGGTPQNDILDTSLIVRRTTDRI
ncbi:MAG: GntR family transcriptional regulator [Clostridiales bacterium]|nr:GntR family transcriptional regulator [Clostridiales bacterium]